MDQIQMILCAFSVFSVSLWLAYVIVLAYVNSAEAPVAHPELLNRACKVSFIEVGPHDGREPQLCVGALP